MQQPNGQFHQPAHNINILTIFTTGKTESETERERERKLKTETITSPQWGRSLIVGIPFDSRSWKKKNEMQRITTNMIQIKDSISHIPPSAWSNLSLTNKNL